MRQDMAKLYFERGRSRFIQKPGRQCNDLELLPTRTKMTKNRDSCRNVRFSVVKRWLKSKVGSSWDSVYSDVASITDSRAFSQFELRDRVKRMVTTNTQLGSDGTVYDAIAMGYGSRRLHVAYGFYVHPCSRVLCFKDYPRYRGNKSEKKKTRIDINEFEQLHLVDNIWYRVFLSPLKPLQHVTYRYKDSDGREIVKTYPRIDSYSFDVLLKQDFERPTYALKECYGRNGVFGVEKQQLSHKELKAYGLL